MNTEYKTIVDTLLTKSVLKKKFSITEIELFANNINFQKYKKDDQIITEGEPATSLMFIISGKVRVCSQDHQLAILHDGQMFGESMFSDEGSRTAHVIAVEDTSAVVFTMENYKNLITDSPDTALKYKHFFETIYQNNKNKNEKFFHVDSIKYLALIAHNEMKNSLVNFVEQHIDLINNFPLVATGTTGQILYKNTGLVLSRKVKSGPLGGDQAIGSMISTDNICGVLFLRDPLSSHPHHADIEALGRLCDVYQIPFATNTSTAKAVLTYLTNN
ncbi:MAG: methylglyoxal synthase [Desulfobacteraceae bacterium]|nr:methylglyoxal synthase [Desulfobacteraceae bacterium]